MNDKNGEELVLFTTLLILFPELHPSRGITTFADKTLAGGGGGLKENL